MAYVAAHLPVKYEAHDQLIRWHLRDYLRRVLPGSFELHVYYTDVVGGIETPTIYPYSFKRVGPKTRAKVVKAMDEALEYVLLAGSK